MTTITIPISRRTLDWVNLILYPFVIFMGTINIIEENNLLNATVLAIGILGTMFFWSWKIIDWYYEDKLPTLKFRCD